jgi:hypothetical protein
MAPQPAPLPCAPEYMYYILKYHHSEFPFFSSLDTCLLLT